MCRHRQTWDGQNPHHCLQRLLLPLTTCVQDWQKKQWQQYTWGCHNLHRWHQRLPLPRLPSPHHLVLPPAHHMHCQQLEMPIRQWPHRLMTLPTGQYLDFCLSPGLSVVLQWPQQAKTVLGTPLSKLRGWSPLSEAQQEPRLCLLPNPLLRSEIPLLEALPRHHLQLQPLPPAAMPGPWRQETHPGVHHSPDFPLCARLSARQHLSPCFGSRPLRCQSPRGLRPPQKGRPPPMDEDYLRWGVCAALWVSPWKGYSPYRPPRWPLRRSDTLRPACSLP
jgi:hypothetical protein